MKTVHEKKNIFVKYSCPECNLIFSNRGDFNKHRKEKHINTGPIAGNSKHKPGPLRVLEVCTWLCIVMSRAFDMGWGSHQPITLPDFDLLKPAGRGLAREYLQEVDPDLLILSFLCPEWSPLQQIN